MRMRLLGLLSGLALLGPLAALAEQPADQQQAGSPAAEQPAGQTGDSVICHYYYYEGTVIKRQVCRSRSAWDRYRIQQEADISEFQMRTLTQHQ